MQRLNTRRQQLTKEAQFAIAEHLEDVDDQSLIFAGDERFLSGIVGLVAGRLAEQFYRPAVILEIGEEESRGSCRSIPEFDITRALDESADLLIRHGGHAMAAGFTVHNSNIDLLRVSLQEKAARALSQGPLRRELAIDLEIDLSDVSEVLLAELNTLEPTGHQNPPACFLSRDLHILSKRQVGQDHNHLKLRIERPGQQPLDAIGFGLGERSDQLPAQIDAAYHVELNTWNGRSALQLRLLDIRPATP